jgi:putative aldouronate transport system substrate-binding protein
MGGYSMNVQSLRKTVSIGMVALSLIVLSACNQNKSAGDVTTTPSSSTASVTTAKPADSLPQVNLVWYYGQPSAQTDLKSVQDEVNKITQQKINATVTLKPIDFGDYTQKMNTIAASGEVFDIVWTANWNFDYTANIGKGVFIPLDDLLNSNGAELKKSLPQFMWDSVKVNGKIYGVPNYQSVTGRQGYIIPKAYADKYKLDVNSIKKIEDIEPFLKSIKDNEPDKSPLVTYNSQGVFASLFNSQGLGTLQVTNTIPPVGYYLNDASLKIINIYDTPEYKHALDIAHQWYQKSYINHDAPTLKSDGVLEKTSTGQGIVTMSGSLNPGTEGIVKNRSYGGKDVVYAPLTPILINGNPGIATVNAISRTSKNPERAMMLLNLVNTNKNLFNLLSFGIEGKHYTKIDDKTIHVNDKAGYAPQSAWVMGNTFNGYLVEGQPADTWEVQQKTNLEAQVTPLVGFKLDQSPVTTEIANVQAVLDEYLPALNTGAVDPNTKLPEFLTKLKQAGNDKLIAEIQKQVDAWKSLK